MPNITQSDLKPFQLSASENLVKMLATYPSPPFERWFNPYSQDPYPFLCRLRAITGSGKTPMLALTAANLGDAIVLWTTNRGSVISQTLANLGSGGRYESLLKDGTLVKEFSRLTNSDWLDTVSTNSGLTIILATVALFNREGDALNAHKDRGGFSYWDLLADRGPVGRQRPLYIIYDEAHGGTKAQFARLTELNPRALILASANDLPEELSYLLRGLSAVEKTAALNNQTVTVKTGDVVANGLLKTRLYFLDCNTTRLDALRGANEKWLDISQRLAPTKEHVVCCCIVNSTQAGLEIWAMLTQRLRVDPRRVAVHLANVETALAEASPDIPWHQLINTHKAKKTPEALRNEGYTHLIWNLSLREGWDEPWAYVAYLDGKGKSADDISQKIGRFLRQPNATPFQDGDLNSAYFYFNTPDANFKKMLEAVQKDLEMDGYEVINLTGDPQKLITSREVPCRHLVQIPMVSESFGTDLTALDRILTDNVPLFASEDLKSVGTVSTRVLDLLTNSEDEAFKQQETRNDNADISVWDYLIARLTIADNRIANKHSTRFTPFVKNHPRMSQRLQYGSNAILLLNHIVSTILDLLNDELRLEYEPDQVYEVHPFIMTSPDLVLEEPIKTSRYRVRTFQHSIHAEYNGFNSFEVELATALDELGLLWCRNPSRIGYGIPIPVIGQGTTRFYPDFLLWTKSGIWALETISKRCLIAGTIRVSMEGYH